MQVRLFGVQSIRFTDNNGKEISGTNIFVAFPEENVVGVRTEKFFLKEGINLPKDVKIDENLELLFDRRGKVERICKA